jgi:iron complex transport system substrate-binding protein
VADSLGEHARGEALAHAMDARLTRLRRDQRFGKALYMTEAGVTSGPGTLVHEMMAAAGLDNFQSEQGWHPLPLERLAYERPDMVALAVFGTGSQNAWTAARHPIAQAQLKDRPVVPLQGAWTACGGWFVLDAVEAMAQGRR